MGETIEFASNGKSCSGYLTGSGPGVVVIQEWWGLVPHIVDVADRIASEGFTALAPDLYHGKSSTEPDEAAKLMMDMNLETAAKDMGGAVDELRRRGCAKVGSIGWCMGGALSTFLSTLRPMDATVAFYGYPQQEPDFSTVSGPIQGHFAEHDDFFSAQHAEELYGRIRGMGKQAELFVYPGTSHGFFNDTRPEVANAEAAGVAWSRTLDFLRKNLG